MLNLLLILINEMNCALCQKKPRDEDSHIIPAFVFRWLKQTSATGYLRGTEEPNKRLQDGKKYPLLCRECEDHFAKYEDEFARRIFHPYAKSQRYGLPYDEFCLKFFASVVWRALHHLWITKSDPDKDRQLGLEGKMDAPYEAWRDFLLDLKSSPGDFTINVFPVDDIETATVADIPYGASQYNTGAIDMDLVCCDQHGHVYVKLPYFLIFGKIFEKRSPKFSKNTLVRLKKGNLGGRNMCMPENMMDYIHSRTQVIRDQTGRISERQWSSIMKSVEQNPERVANSRSMKSAMFDAKLRRDNI